MRVSGRLAGGELKDHARIYVVIVVVLALTMGSFLVLTSYEQYMVQITQDGIGSTISGDGMILAEGTTVREAYGGAETFDGASDKIARIENQSGYRAVPRLTLQGAAQHESRGLEGAVIRGLDPDLDEQVFELRSKLVDGTYFTDEMQYTQGTTGQAANTPPSVGAGNESSDDYTSRFSDPYPVIVGETFAENRNLTTGDIFQILVQTGPEAGDYASNKVRIVGVYRVGLPLMEQLMHFMHIDSIRELAGVGPDSATEIAVADPAAQGLAEPDTVDADLQRMAPTQTTYTWHDVVVYVSGTMMDTINILLYGTMAVTLLLAGAAIHHVMDGIVLRKIREIGSLKAFGARQNTILGVFLVQALVIGGLAGLAGVGVGYGVVSWARWQGLQTEFLAGSAIKIDFVLTTHALVSTVLVPTIVSVVASLPPALRAARLPPVEALRKGELAL